MASLLVDNHLLHDQLAGSETASLLDLPSCNFEELSCQ